MRLSKDDFTHELNSSLLALQQQVEYVKLGPLYSEMSFEAARRNLTFHRMFKNFEQPDDQKQNNVKDSSVAAMFSYDENQGNSISRFTRLPLEVRKDLYALRISMQAQLKNCTYKRKLQITTGENVVSRNGDTSVYSKLSDITAWTCSPKNIENALKIVADNRVMRRMLASHYNSLLWKDYIKRRSLLTVAQVLALPKAHWKTFRKRHFSFLHRTFGNVLYQMFKKVITLCSHARITTVPKDNEKARVIITCPLFDMISQRSDAAFIKQILFNEFGMQLNFTQNIQRNRIYNYENATIDFSNASNSTRFDSVSFLLSGTKFFGRMISSCARVVKYKDDWHKLNMFSPMGCGSTFELMTWILLSAARLFDSNATVFGDDVVIAREHVQRFIRLTSALGYEVNVTKTFTEGYFRESCGSFLSHSKPVKCFDFEWAQDFYSAVILMNKLRLVRHGIPELERLYHRLIPKVPLLTFKMAPDDHPVLDDGIPSCENLVRKQRKCSKTKLQFAAVMGQNTYARRSSRITQYYIREILTQECDTLWDEPRDVDVDLATYAHYMYAMRVQPPTLRNTEHTRSKIVLCEINNNLPVTFD